MAAVLTFFAAAAAGAKPCRLEQAQAAAASRRTAEARLLFQECASESPTDSAVAIALGRFYLQEGNDGSAVRWMENAARLDPSNSEYQLWLGRAYGSAALHANVLRQPSLAKKVRRAFERAVELDAGNLAARQSLVEYYLRAPGFLGGSSPRAREQAEEIRRRDPMRGHRAFGCIAEHEKRFDLAQEEYERAVAEFPEAPDPVYWRVDLAVRQKDFSTAFDRLLLLLSRNRSEPEALYRIGELAAISGQRLDRGESSLKTYLDHQPTSEEPSLAEAHFRLGAIYDRKKDRDAARREYRAALELDPMLTEARQALARR